LLGEGRDDKAEGQPNGEYYVEFHDLLWELSSIFYHSGDFRRFAHIASPSTLRLLPMQRCRAQVGLPKEH
jgi:hypothetical protein